MNIPRLPVVLIPVVFLLLNSCGGSKEQFNPGEIPFNNGWEFIITGNDADPSADSIAWQSVKLPHTPVIEPLVVNDQWQGTCWYRKRFMLNEELTGKNLFLRFEGAMLEAEVWVNGVKKGHHLGGYLPFTVDFTGVAHPGDTNVVLVRLDNRDNPVTGPKPLAVLDFNMYGGLYRDVFLIAKNELYITDPVHEGIPAGGGIFVTYPEVTRERALLNIKTHLRNSSNQPLSFIIRQQLLKGDSLVLEKASAIKKLPAFASDHYSENLDVRQPTLWSPRDPQLYELVTSVVLDGILTDSDTTRIGIKSVEFMDNQLHLNGQKLFLRGVNRHQEYPYVGYALSHAAHYRDAVKIKEAGFDYVRLSHYPHAPAFMDACDEIGLLVIDAILGWQYYSDEPAFQEHIYQTCRDLVRRDRNHACVLAWEVSLNESWMPEFFIDSLTAITHREYPGDQCFTAGWQEYGYDIYLQARQHRLQHYTTPEKPYVVSEYGDWEYYAMNAGLNQDSWQDLQQEERSSRQLLAYGEGRLLQQARNIQEAHNDNFNTPAFADGYWVMFDYNRGYADDLEASGIMSINRLPKFSYYFFRSQRDQEETGPSYSSGPMVYIASYWDERSAADVRIFSNCQEVELWLNDSLLAKQSPDHNLTTSNLSHPPFTFNTGFYKAGTLTAIGLIDGTEAARHTRRTPGIPVALRLVVDESSTPPLSGINDLLFVYAEVIDEEGTIVPANDIRVTFRLEGDGELVSPPTLSTEAGIASALFRVGDTPGKLEIKGTAAGLRDGFVQTMAR